MTATAQEKKRTGVQMRHLTPGRSWRLLPLTGDPHLHATAAAAAAHGLRALKTQHYPKHFTREPWKQPWGARETAVWRLRWGKPPTSVCWKSADLSRARLCLCLPAINEMYHAHLQFSTLPDVSVHFWDSGDYTATENTIPPYFTWAALCTVSTRQKHAFVSRYIRI